MSVLACPACLNTLWDYLLLWHHGKNKCMCCDLIFLHSVLWVFLPSLNSFVFESKTERECVCVCVCLCPSSSLSIHRPGEQVIGRFIAVVTTRAIITSISASECVAVFLYVNLHVWACVCASTSRLIYWLPMCPTLLLSKIQAPCWIFVQQEHSWVDRHIHSYFMYLHIQK